MGMSNYVLDNEEQEAREIATSFLLRGIQQWGQSQEDHDMAVRQYVEAAGFEYGSVAATRFLGEIERDLPRGECNAEIRWLEKKLIDTRVG